MGNYSRLLDNGYSNSTELLDIIEQKINASLH